MISGNCNKLLRNLTAIYTFIYIKKKKKLRKKERNYAKLSNIDLLIIPPMREI